MQRVRVILFLTILGASVLETGTVAAATSSTHTSAIETVSFRLHVSGAVPATMTFWAAYGPVEGRFGLVQLKQTSSGQFTGGALLPTGKSGIVSYLAGRGVVQTRFGPAPGNPVFTIRRTAKIPLSTRTLPLVRWSAPQG